MNGQPPLHPKSVLVVGAHPDDPEFTAGGSIAYWASNQSLVHYVIVTDGSKGTVNPTMEGPALIARRKSEQLAAAKRLGVSEVIFLDYPDGEVFDTQDLRRDLVRQIRMHRPDLVLTHDPTARILRDQWINHPDHLAVGNATLAAVFPLARDRLSFPGLAADGLDPHQVMHVLLFHTDSQNVTLDITNYLELKLAAILEHRSQIADIQPLEDRIRERASMAAMGTNFSYGESFRHIGLRR